GPVASEVHLGGRVRPQPREVAAEGVARLVVQVVAVEAEVDVLEEAVLLRAEAALGALEARAAEPLLADPAARRAGRALTGPRPLLLARAAERDDQHERQGHAPGPRAAHAIPSLTPSVKRSLQPRRPGGP